VDTKVTVDLVGRTAFVLAGGGEGSAVGLEELALSEDELETEALALALADTDLEADTEADCAEVRKKRLE
jgi:hypothetical protein